MTTTTTTTTKASQGWEQKLRRQKSSLKASWICFHLQGKTFHPQLFLHIPRVFFFYNSFVQYVWLNSSGRKTSTKRAAKPKTRSWETIKRATYPVKCITIKRRCWELLGHHANVQFSQRRSDMFEISSFTGNKVRNPQTWRQKFTQ